jgi:hypothetical protein
LKWLSDFSKTGDPALAEKILNAILPDVHLFVLTKVPKQDVDDVRQDAVFAIALPCIPLGERADQNFSPIVTESRAPRLPNITASVRASRKRTRILKRCSP